MSIDLYVMQPVVVMGARGEFVERVQELVNCGLLDLDDLDTLAKEFPDRMEAVNYLREVARDTPDGLISVSWG